MSRRKKGDVEWIDMAKVCPGHGFEGIQVGIEHVGPGVARRWSFRLEALRRAELARIIELRKQFSKEDFPDLYATSADGSPTTASVEGMEALSDLCVDILRECLAGVRGAPEVEGVSDRQALADYVRYLAVAESLLAPAIAIQSLKAEDIFTEGPRNLGAERSASVDE